MGKRIIGEKILGGKMRGVRKEHIRRQSRNDTWEGETEGRIVGRRLFIWRAILKQFLPASGESLKPKLLTGMGLP